MRSIRVIIASSLITASHAAAFQSTITAAQRGSILQKGVVGTTYAPSPPISKCGTAHAAPIVICAGKNHHRPLWSTSTTSTDAPSQPRSVVPIANTAGTTSGKRSKLKALGKKVLRKRRAIRIRLIKSTAFLAGVSNILCFKRHGCYASMMTGNTMKCAKAVSEPCFADLVYYALLITSYLVGFGAYRIADQTVVVDVDGGTGGDLGVEVPPTTPAVIAPIVFGIFALYDVLWASTGSQWLVLLLAVACGTINSASAESTGVVTGMMTGNLQRLATYTVDAVLHRIFRGDGDDNGTDRSGPYYFPKPSAERRTAVRTSLEIIAFFAAGIVLASAGMRRYATLASELVVHGAGGFTVLGGAYAALLCMYSFPSALKMSFRGVRLPPLPVRTNGDRAVTKPPCELDLYETECLVEDYEGGEEGGFVEEEVGVYLNANA